MCWNGVTSLTQEAAIRPPGDLPLPPSSILMDPGPSYAHAGGSCEAFPHRARTAQLRATATVVDLAFGTSVVQFSTGVVARGLRGP